MDKKVNSAIISSYEYDSAKYELTVTFKSGEAWTYKNVMPPVVSTVFDSPGSVGSKFLRLIKKQYQSVKSN